MAGYTSVSIVYGASTDRKKPCLRRKPVFIQRRADRNQRVEKKPKLSRMAIDPSLRELMDAYKAVKDEANAELQNLLDTFKGQKQLLDNFLGLGTEGAAKRLEQIESSGTEAIPNGLRQDVLDAYNKLAQIIKDAPSELQVDPGGTQALRAELTARASQLLEETGGGAGAAAGGAGALSGLSVGAIAIALIAIALVGGGAWWGWQHYKSGKSAHPSGTPGAQAQVATPNSNWESELQRVRLQAITQGNIALYNQLVTSHTNVYREHGMKPCDSVFFPSGCAATHASSSCPPVQAVNAVEALQMEQASDHNVCWAREGNTLVALSDLPPDQNYKVPKVAMPSDCQGCCWSVAGTVTRFNYYGNPTVASFGPIIEPWYFDDKKKNYSFEVDGEQMITGTASGAQVITCPPIIRENNHYTESCKLNQEGATQLIDIVVNGTTAQGTFSQPGKKAEFTATRLPSCH